MNSINLAAIVSLASLLLLTPAAGAQSGGGVPGPMHARRAMMMKKLAEACKGKAADESCSFTRMNGEAENGICIMMRDRLICRPAEMGHRHGMGMGPGSMSGPGAARGNAPMGAPAAAQ